MVERIRFAAAAAALKASQPDIPRLAAVVEFLRSAAKGDLSSLECRVLSGYLKGRTYRDMAGRLARPAKAIDNALQRAKRKVGRALCEVS